MINHVPVTVKEVTLSLRLNEGELRVSRRADAIGIAVQAIRRHLLTLKGDVLIQLMAIAMGPARPSNLWHLTIAGEKFFNYGKGIEKFILDLLSSIEPSFTYQSINKILTKQALAKAEIYRYKICSTEIFNRIFRFVYLRNKEVNRPYFSIFEDHLTVFYLNAFDCSIKPVLSRYPFFCEQELQLLCNIFPDFELDRIDWRMENSKTCGFKITSNK